MGQARGRSGRVTLSDVAAQAGVSATTASFVLSGRTDMRISSATAQRVVEVARSLGYASPAGRPDGLQLFPTIGFVTDVAASDADTGPLLRGALSAARQRGYAVLVVETGGASGLADEAVAELVDRGVDRVVLASATTREVPGWEPPEGVRVVLANCHDAHDDLPSVLPDDRGAGLRVARLLLDAGHSDRIWLVGEVGRSASAGAQRLAGLAEGLAGRRVGLDQHLRSTWWPPDAREVTAEALGRHRLPTAVVALHERVALGVYQALVERGLSIPGDVSVVGFDGAELAGWLHPGLTGLGLPHHDLGRRAVERLLSSSAETGRERVAVPLHQRGSVAAPAGRRRLEPVRGVAPGLGRSPAL